MLTQTPNSIMIFVNGPDSFEFLQNIITNDLNKISKKQHNFILTPQGKIRYEILISKNSDDEYLIECSNNQNYIFEYFLKYAELSDVRLNSTKLAVDSKNYEDHITKTLSNGIIDTNFLQTEKFYPSEISSNAIDYEKGCYVGQEVVSRMKHRQLNKNFIRIFEKIDSNIDSLKTTAEDILIKNYEFIDEYKNYIIVKFKENIQEVYLKHNHNLYKLINKNI